MSALMPDSLADFSLPPTASTYHPNGTFFRRILIDNGEDPEHLVLSEIEQTLFDFGRAIVKDHHNIPDSLYEKLEKRFSETQMIQIIACAGQMYATNIFVTTARVDLDEILLNYRKKD